MQPVKLLIFISNPYNPSWAPRSNVHCDANCIFYFQTPTVLWAKKSAFHPINAKLGRQQWARICKSGHSISVTSLSIVQENSGKILFWLSCFLCLNLLTSPLFLASETALWIASKAGRAKLSSKQNLDGHGLGTIRTKLRFVEQRTAVIEEFCLNSTINPKRKYCLYLSNRLL